MKREIFETKAVENMKKLCLLHKTSLDRRDAMHIFPNFNIRQAVVT
jgi:hypothetical protein